MKQTEIERKERELKQAQKKIERLEKRSSCEEGMTVGDCIDRLEGLFFHDTNRIYNLSDDPKILDFLKSVKENIPEKQWDNIIRKAVKKTGIQEKDKAVKELNRKMGEL